jgi:hypothetical protein
MEGLPVAHFLAAAGAILAIPLTWRWKLAMAFENEVPFATRWNEDSVAPKIANFGKADGVADCCAGSEVHNEFSRHPTLWDLSVSRTWCWRGNS